MYLLPSLLHTPTHRPSSLKALMDAVAQVSGGPSIPFPFPTNIHPAAALGFANHNSMVLSNNQGGGPLRKRDHERALSAKGASTAGAKKAKTGNNNSTQEEESKRVKRLEQNRTAAIESRRRKKHMVEELQRSVQYFSRANSVLKSQNAELERQLLLAKHKILAKGSSSGDDAVVLASATTECTIPNTPTVTEIAIVKAPLEEETTKPAAKLVPASNVSCSYDSSVPPNMEIEEQARQAQFAATQALYKSMGYPAGAARTAASTFSQFVGQTGIAPGLSAATSSRESVRPSKRRNSTTSSSLPPTASSSALIPVMPKLSTKVESDGDAYIEALNQFALQQAAAANAAAAAATEAMQAVNIHNQLKHKGGAFPSSSSASPTAPSFPFSFPNTDVASWPFRNASSFSTKE